MLDLAEPQLLHHGLIVSAALEAAALRDHASLVSPAAACKLTKCTKELCCELAQSASPTDTVALPLKGLRKPQKQPCVPTLCLRGLFGALVAIR